MIDLIRAKVLPSALVQSMARGAIALPPREVIEILVYLANHNPEVQDQAKKTLTGWNEKQIQMVVVDPKAPKEVVEYFAKQAPALKPVVAVKAVVESIKVENIKIKEPEVAPQPAAEIAITKEFGIVEEASQGNLEEEHSEAALEFAVMADNDQDVAAFLKEHEQDLAIELAENKPFKPIGGNYEEEIIQEAKTMTAAAGVGGATTSSASDAIKKPSDKKGHMSPEQERGSVLQKISRLDIKGRIQLALKGTKEERSILIRDSAKLVCLAVLESPKITDGEVEKFASQKNVLEAVLRQIPMKRRFMKNYIIMRNLIFNPRTPLDLSLGLMKNLLIADLKNLSGNKEVSDTIRKLALKMFKQKSNPTKNSG
jgi:hypothetical protein